MSDWRALGLDDWTVVIANHARPEPCRPTDMAVHPRNTWGAVVAASLGLTGTGITLRDHQNRPIAIGHGLVAKLAKYANHAAYAGWIPTTLLNPLEVWERPYPELFGRPRRYYLSAYLGPSNHTTHVAIAVTNNTLINSFRIEAIATANGYRYSPSQLPYLGY